MLPRVGGGGGKGALTCILRKEYQTMPDMARLTPRNRFKGIASPKRKQPPESTMTVFT
jgi:hypothetical protein